MNENYIDPLTAFIYLLIADVVPANKVADLIKMIAFEGGVINCENEHLLKYSQELSVQLKEIKSVGLNEALVSVFGKEKVEAEKKKQAADLMEKLRKNNGNMDEFSDEELSELELVAKRQCGLNEKVAFNSISVEEAKEIIDDIKTDGNMTDEEAERIKKELDEVVIDPSVEQKDIIKGEIKCEK